MTLLTSLKNMLNILYIKNSFNESISDGDGDGENIASSDKVELHRSSIGKNYSYSIIALDEAAIGIGEDEAGIGIGEDEAAIGMGEDEVDSNGEGEGLEVLYSKNDALPPKEYITSSSLGKLEVVEDISMSEFGDNSGVITCKTTESAENLFKLLTYNNFIVDHDKNLGRKVLINNYSRFIEELPKKYDDRDSNWIGRVISRERQISRESYIS